jgi:hypothetical protein
MSTQSVAPTQTEQQRDGTGTDPKVWPRKLIDDGQINSEVKEYVLLIPAGQDMSPRDLMRLIAIDTLQRNGRPVDPKAVEAIVDGVIQENGGPDFNAGAVGENAKRKTAVRGPTNADYTSDSNFDGYSFAMSVASQKAYLEMADKVIVGAPLNDKSPETMGNILESIKQLKLLAAGMNDTAAKEALETIEKAIESKDGSALKNTELAMATFKTVIEFTGRAIESRDPNVLSLVKSMGGASTLAMEATELLGRTSNILSLPLDVVNFSKNLYTLYNGKDDQGKPLSRSEYVKVLTDLADDGLSTANGLSSLVQTASNLFGKTQLAEKAALVSETAARWAPPIAVLSAYARLGVETGKLYVAATDALLHVELRDRFAEGKKPSEVPFILDAMKERISKLPVDPGNAELTAKTILRDFFKNSDTNDRFRTFLKQFVDNDANIDRLASGKGVDKIPLEELVKIAKAAKQALPEFINTEVQKSVDYYFDKSPNKKRDDYLKQPVSGLSETTGSENIAFARKWTPDQPSGQLLITSDQHPLHDLYKQAQDKITPILQTITPHPQEQTNLTASIVASALDRGLEKIDRIWRQPDDPKLYAIQGVLDSSTNKIAALEIAKGLVQPVSDSTLFAERAGRPKSATEPTADVVAHIAKPSSPAA